MSARVLNRIAVTTNEAADPRGSQVARSLRDEFGVSVKDVEIVDVYTVEGKLTDQQLEQAGELLANPVIEKTSINQPAANQFDWLVEIGYRPGVTDNVGGTARQTLSDLLGADIPGVYTSRQYVIHGKANGQKLEQAVGSLLYNDLTERCRIVDKQSWQNQPSLFESAPVIDSVHKPKTEPVNLDLSDQELLELSHKQTLALSLEEMKTIRDYFAQDQVRKERAKQGLPAQPTDVELESLAQTWSEHCKHKIFNAEIDYRDGDKRETIKSIFKTYIRKSTEDITKQRDWLVSVFTDNAGIIKFTDEWNLVMKAETHNSPSALDPYGGAITGILGVNRDTVGAGKGASPIFNTNVFCFASPFYDKPLPSRLLHPRRIFENVRRGVEHGGNKTGIPTVNGSVVFDQRFLGKPLVYCGTGGLIPTEVDGRPSEEKQINPGDLAIMAGGRIGKDGIRGANFSSQELHEDSPSSAVQIGDPITQKNLFDFLLQARDEGLFKTLTDNGAGGLSSSIGELAELSNGCEINLEQAPLKYPGLDPWEILISESQERMTVVVPPENWDAFAELASKRGVEVSNVGTFTDSGKFHVKHDGQTVGYIDLDFFHNGLPPMRLTAEWVAPKLSKPKLPEPKDLATELKGLLGRLNICSKEYLVRQYDHEVQGTSVVKPLTGAENDGPSDAGVVKPLPDESAGVVVAHGICPRFSDLDTYHMTANAIDEAIRNAVAVGADPAHLAGLDNYCWSDPIASDSNPEGAYKAAQLVRSTKALYDYTTGFGVPCISGKDSMKNDYSHGDIKISVPPTLLFSVVGRIDDVTRAVTMDAKQAGDVVYITGLTKPELGGSEYLAAHDQVGDKVPEVDATEAAGRYTKLHQAISQGLVASAHDLSDGGLGVAAAETAFAGNLGMTIELAKLPIDKVDRDDLALFSESASRLLLTIHPDQLEAFSKVMGTDATPIGEITDDQRLVVSGLNGDTALDAPIGELKAAWQQPLGV